MRFGYPAVILSLAFAATHGHAQSIISTLLGGSQDGRAALSATLSVPSAVVTDANGTVYIALKGAHQVVRIDSSGVLRTIAGNGVPGSSGDGGPAVSALINTPVGLAMDQSGALFIVDSLGSRIRRVGDRK